MPLMLHPCEAHERCQALWQESPEDKPEVRLFRCPCCLRDVCWGFGNADSWPDLCDDCWAAFNDPEPEPPAAPVGLWARMSRFLGLGWPTVGWKPWWSFPLDHMDGVWPRFVKRHPCRRCRTRRSAGFDQLCRRCASLPEKYTDRNTFPGDRDET